MNHRVYRLFSITIAIALALGVSLQALGVAALGGALQPQPAPLQAGIVYYVSTTGKDTNAGTNAAPFRTFAKAVSVLKPSDTLQVLPGTYTESLRMTASGTASAPISVIGNGAIVDMQGTQTTGIKISGSYVTLSNFEIIRAKDAGIAIPGKYVTVRNNILHDNVAENGIGTCGIDTSWASALKVGVGGQNITIENNTVFNNCGEGIAVTRGVNVVVKNNTVYDNFAPNIYIDNSPFSTVQDNLVYCTGARLRRDGTRPTGIGMGEELYDGWGAQMHDVLISGNTVRDCGKGIGAFASEVGGTFTNVTITRNNVPSGFARPIALSTSPNKNVVISYNTIFTDPYISDKAGVTLIGNTIGGVTAPTSTSVSAPTSTKVAPTATRTAAPAATITTTPVTAFTATPTLAATQASTNTPLPTLAFTATPTSGQPATDAIFASSFESGNLSDWSGNANGGGDLSVSPAAALSGANGLQAVINDTTVLSVTSDQPNAEPRYRLRFYFDPNSIAMANGDAHIIVR
ncbi:MAG TPA: right-handed parallel beta-helix repeat-containing protein, partial [Anaerolineales bacterium]|nr:right-handed parallel beta-helix repeat-containing protein [Anaerolineales bacterium]